MQDTENRLSEISKSRFLCNSREKYFKKLCNEKFIRRIVIITSSVDMCLINCALIVLSPCTIKQTELLFQDLFKILKITNICTYEFKSIPVNTTIYFYLLDTYTFLDLYLPVLCWLCITHSQSSMYDISDAFFPS